MLTNASSSQQLLTISILITQDGILNGMNPQSIFTLRYLSPRLCSLHHQALRRTMASTGNAGIESGIGVTATATAAVPAPAPATESATATAITTASPPAMSAADRKIYGSMGQHMQYFHDNFRRTWTLLSTACEQRRRPAGLTNHQFLSTGLQFVRHLEMHHGIEEAHVFPMLARKMPEFAAGPPTAELLRQHREIHTGMDGLSAYLEACQQGERTLNWAELAAQLDSWGGVLWKHLDQEVDTLSAENMCRYWSKEEMLAMSM